MARRQACERDSHSSVTLIAKRLSQPTRTTGLETGLGKARVIPIRFCSRWGLPCRVRCRPRGGLLPHPFTLTPQSILLPDRGGLLSVALSLRSPSPGVTRHRVSMEPGLSSPAAFQHLRQRLSDRLAREAIGGFQGQVKPPHPKATATVEQRRSFAAHWHQQTRPRAPAFAPARDKTG